MKKIEAVIQPSRLDSVKVALNEIGVMGMTVSEVRGFGRTGGKPEVFRGSTYAVDFIPKIRIEIVVTDGQTQPVVDVVRRAANTERFGAGKIWVTPVEEVIRIRTNERGEDAT